MNKFLLAFKYAFNGIVNAIKEERNMKIHLVAVIVVIFLGFVYKISKVEWMICIVLFGLVISSELINTAIEKTVDLVTREENELAKVAKDVAAGAVLVNAVISVVIAVIIWFPKIFGL